ncbi:LysR family transcriptional regulator [Paracoccus sulfuroxidans]|uniref:Transcriptional regulator, LysR family n=1 Tax=Paracoccus sulfuroxidans TaxID=384678 RepID=A0A562NUH5_9RHOB|nr:LysR family transcriptional regulator [Paracoccus sulfuroxidans]TWI35815.1 transcriptional regulator, LysR family [Paracoccus sulfuroxidans]
MRLNQWTEIRTVAQVARTGRVSAAAEVLGMHHSTVIRHIDQLEAAMRTKLFQRHARGYTPTEAGEELLRIANLVDDQFTEMMDRIESARDTVSGQLVVTAIPVADRLVMPSIGRFQSQHPKLKVIYHSDVRTYHLAYGEAHVALRSGTEPNHPDNIVSRLHDARHALYAAKSYVQRFGLPRTEAELAEHRFVITELEEPRAPFHRWLADRIPEESFVFRTGQVSAAYLALQSGVGIGFLNRLAENEGMVPVLPDLDPPEWRTPIWMVTHVDLHRTSKVQSFTRFMHEEAKSWGQAPGVSL